MAELSTVIAVKNQSGKWRVSSAVSEPSTDGLDECRQIVQVRLEDGSDDSEVDVVIAVHQDVTEARHVLQRCGLT